MDEEATMRLLGAIDALEYLSVLSVVGMAAKKENPIEAINATIDAIRGLAEADDAPYSGDPVRAALAEAREIALSRIVEKSSAMLFAGSRSGNA